MKIRERLEKVEGDGECGRSAGRRSPGILAWILAACSLGWVFAAGKAESQTTDAAAKDKVDAYRGVGGLPLPPPPLPEGWQRVAIPDVGTIDIPPTMEVLGGKNEAIRKEIFGGKSTPMASDERTETVIYQKGMNDLDPAARKLYVRVMVGTVRGKHGEAPLLTEGIADTYENRSLAVEELKKMEIRGNRILELHGPDPVVLAGMKSSRVRYRRQLGTNPPVAVDYYVFTNYDRVHNLTVAYRESDKVLWESDMPRVIASFRITNVRGAPPEARGPLVIVNQEEEQAFPAAAKGFGETLFISLVTGIVLAGVAAIWNIARKKRKAPATGDDPTHRVDPEE